VSLLYAAGGRCYLRVAIVHHWLVTQGGGERVLEALASIFPDADIFTLIADPKSISPQLKGRRITQSFLGRLPWSGKLHRHLLPLYPMAVEQLDLQDYDLVITSDAGPMKGVIVAPGALHICYCHTPMRYIWNQYHDYRNQLSGPAKYAFAASAHYVRGWDFAAAQRVSLFAANSVNVSDRIRQYYARPSLVLYPPVDTSRASLESSVDESYLAVGRLVAYKRFDLLIAACNRLGRRLRIIGVGPEERTLRALAGRSIEFLGHVENDALWSEYARCRAFLFAADEDFGLAPVEAQACGRPVIAFGKGGALESIAAGRDKVLAGRATGIFFAQQSIGALCDAILEFERKERHFNPVFISDWAKRFDSAYFVDGFRELVNVAMASCERPSTVDEPTPHSQPTLVSNASRGVAR
jgi:glycosyltransferase involved in cell wall biosynthesis